MIIIYIYLIMREVGNFGLVTLAILTLCLSGQIFFDKYFSTYNAKRMAASDKRGKRINEMITGIKVIKFNAWEKILDNLINQFRVKEGKFIFREFMIYNMSQAINSLSPTFMGLTIFTLYQHFSGKGLTIPQVYQLISLFNSFAAPIKFVIMGNTTRLDANVSKDRLNSYFNLKPIERKEDSFDLRRGEFEVKNGSFNWNDPHYYKLFEKKEMGPELKNAYILKKINLKISKGEFVAVIGKVGSGKSSLILALMDEMVRHQGYVKKNGRMAYISQEAFLQNDTIENNIVFGKEYDAEKLKDVISICEMNPDLDILPGREKTEIGERGINMSGGQKQRINIARAVYSDSDIYLIDDALSALDAHVGKKIMNNVFKERLEGKTRVMVTHFLHLLNDVDKVVLVDEGEIKAYGTFEEVKGTNAFQEYVSTNKKQEEDKGKEGEEEGAKEQGSSEKAEKTDNKAPGDVAEKDRKESTKKLKNLENDEKEDKEGQEKDDEDKENAGKLTVEEKRDTGMSGLKFYSFYIKNIGVCLTLITIFCFGFSVTLKLVCDWWVGRWAENTYKLPRNTYILIYLLIGLLAVIFMITRSVLLGCVAKRGALKMFRGIAWNILRRPMSFFDTTPTGVIINRCTSDVNEVDFMIPWEISFMFSALFMFLGGLTLAVAAVPAVVVFIGIGVLMVYRSLRMYLKTSVEVRRLMQLGISPIVSIASEFIDGSTTLRVYGKGEVMLGRYREKANVYHTAYHHSDRVTLWMRTALELSFGFVFVFIVISVVLNQQFR